MNLLLLFWPFRKSRGTPQSQPVRQIWCRRLSIGSLEPRFEKLMTSYIYYIRYEAGYVDGKDEFQLTFAPQLMAATKRTLFACEGVERYSESLPISVGEVPSDIVSIASDAFSKEIAEQARCGLRFDWDYIKRHRLPV